MTNKSKLEYMKTAMRFQHRELKRIIRGYEYGSIHKDLKTLLDHQEATLHALDKSGRKE